MTAPGVDLFYEGYAAAGGVTGGVNPYEASGTYTLEDKVDIMIMLNLLLLAIVSGYMLHTSVEGSARYFSWICIPCLASVGVTVWFYGRDFAKSRLLRAVRSVYFGSGRPRSGGTHTDARQSGSGSWIGCGSGSDPVGATLGDRLGNWILQSELNLNRPESAKRRMPPLCFPMMSIVAGVFSGVFGIGGGLIFSPFMLYLGVHPATAVATSSTCVIFTSTSTTLQYMMQHRIIIPYGIFYGCISFGAAQLGNNLVATLRQKGGPLADAALIFIVGLAVSVSAVMVLIKLV